MIDSVEENWDVTFIMSKGQIKRVCHRGELSAGQSLEDVYFEITEGAPEVEQ
jgi:ABC-2 type transport system ATP-binding protein